MKILTLALRLLWRDLRAGELSLLIIALLIAITSTTTISLFTDRLQRSINLQASEFLAGDLAISTANALPSELLDQASQLNLQQAQTCEFNSVLLENNETLLVSVKAVSAAYPLRGQLSSKTSDTALESNSQQGPEPGNAWVEQRVLSALNLKLGQSLNVGEQALVVSRILTNEPDKRNQFYALSPRVMINQADLAATKVIQPGSRVHYEYQFIGELSALSQYKDWLNDKLPASARLLDIQKDRPDLGSAISRAEQYLGLSSLVVVMIAGVAIAMSSHRYAQRHFDTTALLRCLGAKASAIFFLYTWQFLLLGISCSLLSCALAWLGQLALVNILADLLPKQLATPGWQAYCLGFSTGLAILLGFALPPLLALQAVTPLRVLRRDLAPLSSRTGLVYLLLLLLITALVWRYTGNWRLTALVLAGEAATVLLLGAIVYGLLVLVAKKLTTLPLIWRLPVQNLVRNRLATVGQIIALCITLSAMALSLVIRTDLMADWQRQVPEQAPNHFAINIFSEQLTAFQDFLQQAQISSSLFYPVVRGRLTEINNTPLQQRLKQEQQNDDSMRRELSLTWASSLPEDNQVISGATWQDLTPDQVSIEQKFAENLHIQLGDQLSFTIGTEKISAKVVNIRTVHWNSMRPNFFVIFSPGSLKPFPSTYLTSFYVQDQQKSQLNALIKQFPAVSLFDVGLIIQQFKTILIQLTAAINLLLYFSLLAGVAVLLAAIQASIDQRRYQTALMRTLGGKTKLLRTAHTLEFAILGAISGILATIVCESLRYLLYQQLIHIDYQPNAFLWWLLPTTATLLVSLVGMASMQSVFKPAPLAVLSKWG